MQHRCIVVAGGKYAGHFAFATVPELVAFTCGLIRGSGLCGGGSCAVYTAGDLLDPKLDPLVRKLIVRHLKVGA